MNETILLISILISIISAGCIAYNAGKKNSREYVTVVDFKEFQKEIRAKLDLALHCLDKIKGHLGL